MELALQFPGPELADTITLQAADAAGDWYANRNGRTRAHVRNVGGTIKRVRANLNPALDIAGLLRTMYDPRNTLSQQVSRELEAHFGDKVFRTLVPRNVRLAEAPSYGVPAVLWDPSSKGAQAYMALAGEMLEREMAYS